MNPEEIKKAIEDIQKRLKIQEEKMRDHQHTGLDGVKVNFTDLNAVLHKEVTINPGSLSDGAGETEVVAFPGVNLGDFVLVSAPYDLQDVTVTGYVQATDVVEIRVQNESGGVRDLASGVWRIIIIKKLIQ